MKHPLLNAGAVSLLLAAAGLVTAPGSAQDYEFNGLAGSHRADTDGNVAMNGMAVTLRGRVGGNLNMDGASVDAYADVGGDVELNGASVEFEGSVGGSTRIAGAAVSIEGAFEGPVDIAGASLRLSGSFSDAVTIDARRAVLEGGFRGPVVVMTEEGGGWLGGSTSRATLNGAFESGATVCAHEVILGEALELGAPLAIRADSQPDLPSGLDPALITFEDRDGRACD